MADATKISLPPRRVPGLPAIPNRVAVVAFWQGGSIVLLALAVCWLVFFAELRGEWQINSQYSFGYVVPLLGLVLIWSRWQARPAPVPGKQTGRVIAIVIGLLLLALPLRLALEANPEWRLLYWLHGFQVLALSACLLYYLGGFSWALFFAPAFGFMLVAVPWPMIWEQVVIQGLMRLVAAVTVGIGDWLGIAAVQHGNLVEVGAGMVGIDEACSGVRSLQSALMLSLFVGEMYRCSVARRIALVGGSLLFVLVGNIARTTFLVWTAANRGLHQMELWHDVAGNLVMATVLLGLLLVAYLIRPADQKRARRESHGLLAFETIPVWVGSVAICWLLTAEAITEAWYRMHESHLVPNARWSVAWPIESPEFRKSAVPKNSLQILRCAYSEAASWQDDDGNDWSGFFLRWPPGSNSAQLAKGHSPDICLPAAGLRRVKDLGQVSIPVRGLELPFRHEIFENNGALLHVFYCLWSDQIMPGGPVTETRIRPGRLQAVLAGKRHLGQQVLELVLRSPDSDGKALSLLKTTLPKLIQCSLDKN